MKMEATVGVVEGGGPARKLVQGMHSDASTLRKANIWLEATCIVNEAKAWSNLKSFLHRKRWWFSLAASVTYPLDLVRTRLSAQGVDGGNIISNLRSGVAAEKALAIREGFL
uniref:Uncharacterized protein n=1 Tax=Lactuca sativa TaxID=4236 RepID=A0A9R1X6U0_LACSA|nr:hypothetical protein LSAT_V11C600324530 [Lactuca sativa]